MADSQQFKTAERHLTQALESDQRLVTFRDVARELGCHVHLAKNLLLHYFSTHPDVIPTYLLSGPLLATSAVAQTDLTRAASPSATATQSLAHLSATQKIRVVHMDEMSEDEWNSEAEEEEEQKEEDFEELARAEESIKVDGDDALDDVVPRWGVVLVNQDNLDDKKKLFSDGQLSIHIYSLAPAPLKDPALYLSASASLRSHSSYIDASAYGTISGPSLGASGPKRMRDGGLDLIAKKAEVKTEPKADVKGTAVKKEAKKEEKKSFFARKESPADKEETKSKEQKKPPTQPRSLKNKRRIITSDDEDDDEPPVSGSSKSPSRPPKSTKPSLEPTSSMVRADDQAAMEAMMTMDVDFDDIEEISQPKAKAAPSGSKHKGTGRKRRQVKKSKVEMDDKGYMVTKDYYTDESYSGSDTDTDAPKPASTSKRSSVAPPAKKEAPARASGGAKAGAAAARPAPARSTAPKKPAPLGQSSLAGFFKKK